MGYPPFDDKWLRHILDLQRQLEKYYDPVAKAIEERQKTLDYLKAGGLSYPYEDLLNPRLEDFLRIADVHSDILSLQGQIAESLGSVGAMSTELERLRKAKLFEGVLSYQERLYAIQDEYKRYTDLIEVPTQRIESVLAASEASGRFWNLPDSFNELTLSSVEEYQAFIERQYMKLDYDNDEIAERRVIVTDLSGGLFEAINASLDVGGAIQSAIDHDSTEKETVTAQKSGLYSHVNQHLGFVYSNSFKGDIGVSFNRSKPARLVFLGYSITEQIYKINAFSEGEGQGVIFKPTAKTMRACGIITSHTVSNEMTFNQLIDQLYFLLYEGSGSAKRLTPMASESTLNPLWKLKHLRLAARHDVDHGDSRSVRLKQIKIGDAFTSLLGRPTSIKPGDWLIAQLRLYEEIDIMLKLILESMQNRSKEDNG